MLREQGAVLRSQMGVPIPELGPVLHQSASQGRGAVLRSQMGVPIPELGPVLHQSASQEPRGP